MAEILPPDCVKPLPPTEIKVPATLNTPTHQHKLVFLGDETVGKTSIITRYIYGAFDDAYKVTIGIDFVSKTVYVGDKIVRLQLWDTAGQERFRSMIPSYIRDSSVAIVVYDVSSQASLLNTERWIDDIRSERGNDVLIVLVGNKTDLKEQRQVSRGEGERKAKEYGVMHIETSAKSGSNVINLFQQLSIALSTDGLKPSIGGLQEVNLNSSGNAEKLSEGGACAGWCT